MYPLLSSTNTLCVSWMASKTLHSDGISQALWNTWFECLFRLISTLCPGTMFRAVKITTEIFSDTFYLYNTPHFL